MRQIKADIKADIKTVFKAIDIASMVLKDGLFVCCFPAIRIGLECFAFFQASVRSFVLART